MIDATRTTTDLLHALSDGDDKAWRYLDSRYRPILINFARRLGLNDDDAHEVAQATLAVFCQQYLDGRFDRGRGRLRSWLIGMTKLEVLRLRQAVAKRKGFPLGTAANQLPDDESLATTWEEERRAVVLQHAIAELKANTRLSPQSLDIFELVVVRQISSRAAAQQLGVTIRDVHLAKSRCMQRLKTIIDHIESRFAED